MILGLCGDIYRQLCTLRCANRIPSAALLAVCGLFTVCPPLSLCRGCTALEELRLNHNQLRTLPSDLASLQRLCLLDVGGNPIKTLEDVQVCWRVEERSCRWLAVASWVLGAGRRVGDRLLLHGWVSARGADPLEQSDGRHAGE